MVAAALADPIVEFGSNAGWFGRGGLTDHSNLDVGPALLLGIGLLAIYMVRKARAVLAGRALPRNALELVPWIFALQLSTLYIMETCEQLIACGHVLGAGVWLGGPAPISLAVHGALALAVTFALMRAKRALATTTLRAIRSIVEVSRSGPAPLPLRGCWFRDPCSKELMPVLCAIGERAPPL